MGRQAITPSPEHLRGIADAATQVVGMAQQAFHVGILGPQLTGNLRDVHHDLIKMLGIYEDGAGFGKGPKDVLQYMRTLEQVASDLLEAAAKESSNEPTKAAGA